MGIWGWDEVLDYVELRGVVSAASGHTPTLYSGDKDWTFNVEPFPRYAHLLTNPIGQTNRNGLVECEVYPVGKVDGRDTRKAATFSRFFGGLVGRTVTVVGSWSRDRSHTYDDKPVLLDIDGAGNAGKMEIHPVTSILVEPAGADRRRFEFFVFSDAWKRRAAVAPRPVPHNNENRSATFSVSMPAGTTYNVAEQTDRARSKQFDITTVGSISTVTGRIESGRPAEGKGFYHGVVELSASALQTGTQPFGWLDSVQPEHAGVRVIGWAIDPNVSTPIDVQVNIDGGFAGSAVANVPRPDVEQAYPGYGTAHGFDLRVPAAPGAHRVCVYAINAAEGSGNPELGCTDVRVAIPGACGALERRTRELQAAIRRVQAQLQVAAPGEKAELIAEIRDLQEQLADARRELDECVKQNAS